MTFLKNVNWNVNYNTTWGEHLVCGFTGLFEVDLTEQMGPGVTVVSPSKGRVLKVRVV